MKSRFNKMWSHVLCGLQLPQDLAPGSLSTLLPAHLSLGSEFQPHWSPFVLQTGKANPTSGLWTSRLLSGALLLSYWSDTASSGRLLRPRAKQLSLPSGCRVSETLLPPDRQVFACSLSPQPWSPHWQAESRQIFVFLMIASVAARMRPGIQ